MMTRESNLTRFLDAQETAYEAALKEVRNGRKTGHWIWYIFPQIHGLGFSETSRFYAIKDRAEATAYLKHEILGTRLVEISSALLQLPDHDPVNIFGNTDSMKLKSSMTLFSILENSHPIFQQVLDKFFKGEKDERTLKLAVA